MIIILYICDCLYKDYMSDPTAKELLYINKLTYQEKYKLAGILKISAYLPPDNESPIIELPQDMINIICGYMDHIWDLKQTCKQFLNMGNLYQSTIREIKLKHNTPISRIQLFKKYYTGIQKLTIQKVIYASAISIRHCALRANLQMTEFLTWNNLKILELEAYDSFEYIEDNIVCTAESVIIISNVHKFLKVLLKIALPNLKQLHICEKNNIKEDYLWFEDDDNVYKKKCSLEYFSELITKIETLELFSFYIHVKNDDEIKQFLNKIKCPIPKNKDMDYHIKSCKEIKSYRKTEYLVNIEGKFE
ncbi:hypothetical protein Klosneuvirus_3_130 [Klosneuvirus KNV1]|uniref:Uncharacterized protein n=1 Tax=Klosneuvirus KNV1 TaxID=1977640 RepID=A0A1V0SJU0_9VIRU|nr:hypothetical protein Klosneuvirus_3_130 [Klosneuvirus KNV1]